MKRYSLIPAILLLTLTSGCLYELRDEFTECGINCANSKAARRAWKQARGACTGICCPHSFKDGFKAGYIAVANGGSGCVPVVPQIDICNHMWMDRRCTENDKIEAWYDGYEHGAMAAKAEGMQDANRINTRIPHATPVDYTQTGHTNLNSTPSEMPSDSVIPPAPLNETDELGGPQTRL